MRILVLLAIGLLLYIIIGNLWRRGSVSPQSRDDNAERMVKCELCGLHVVERESFREGNHYFCCNDHLVSYRRKQ